MTYQEMEKAFRKRQLNVFLIAMEKAHGDTLTVVNLQGEIDKKYTVNYYLSDKPQRPNMAERWPKSVEDDLERLADAGVPMDRGVEICGNCEQLGHSTRRCPEEKRAFDERPSVKCALCDQEGYVVSRLPLFKAQNADTPKSSSSRLYTRTQTAWRTENLQNLRERRPHGERLSQSRKANLPQLW